MKFPENLEREREREKYVEKMCFTYTAKLVG